MTTEVVREGLCGVPYCPSPNDPDWHRCLICGSHTVEHDHLKGRGKLLTMDTRWVIPLCPHHHRQRSLKQIRHVIHDDPHSTTIILQRVEDQLVLYTGRPAWMQQSADADGGGPVEGSNLGGAEPSPSTPDALPAIPLRLSFEEWAERVQRVGDFIRELPWYVGDLVVYGEDAFGERASQYIEDLGLSVERLSNYAWVARAIPPEERTSLSWSHHRAVAKLPAPQRAELLDKALEDGLTANALAVEAKGEVVERPRCEACGQVLRS